MNDLPLRDIHLPEAISWWPLAIGWWLLLGLLLLSIYAFYQFIKYKKNNIKIAYRKIAISELETIRRKYHNDKNSNELIRAISSLLRRIALSYLAREKAASLTGKQWVQQLNELSSETVFTDDISNLLKDAPYRLNIEFNQDELLDICEKWINALPETKTSLTGNA